MADGFYFKQDLQDNGVLLVESSHANERLWSKGIFILRDVIDVDSDEEFYEGIKNHIYKDTEKGLFVHELIAIQNNLNKEKKLSDPDAVRKQIKAYRDKLMVRGHISGEIEWKKCDLNIIDRLLSYEWRYIKTPSKEIDPKFFSITKGFFLEKKELADEETEEHEKMGLK